MVPVRNEAIVEFEADSLIQLFTQDALFTIDRSRLPADTRVLRGEYDAMRHLIRLVVASRQGRFYDVAQCAVPPVVDGVCQVSDLDGLDDEALEELVLKSSLGAKLLRLARRILDIALDHAF